jgi:hypothetical protein
MRPPRTPSRTQLRADEPVGPVHQPILHWTPSCRSRTGRQVAEPFGLPLSSPSGLRPRPGTSDAFDDGRRFAQPVVGKHRFDATPIDSARSSAVHRRPSQREPGFAAHLAQPSSHQQFTGVIPDGRRSPRVGPIAPAPCEPPTWSFDQIGSQLRVRDSWHAPGAPTRPDGLATVEASWTLSRFG